MGTLAAIFGYLILSALMMFGMSQAARWIVAPENPGAASTAARPAVIPPRIAESIERKKPSAAEPPPPSPARPAMTEFNVSLTPHHQNARVRELAAPKPVKRKKKATTAGSDRRVDSAAPQLPVRGRSDNPYD